MLTVEEFKNKKMNEYGEIDLPQSCIVDDEQRFYGQEFFHTIVWKYETQFFKVAFTGDNSSCWDDGHKYLPKVVEVFPVETIVIKYVERTKDAN